jgi:hypothetical protein
MMSKFNKLVIALACLGMGLGFLGNNAYAQANHAKVKVVRCDEGESVQHILDNNFPARPLKLQLVGLCTGFEITQNDVSIEPFNDDVCPGATVEGGILMVGAFRIEVRCIEVTGETEENGVELVHSMATLEDVDIKNNAGGLEVTERSSIGVVGGEISGNGQGVVVDSASSADFDDTIITGNEGGVDVVQMSRFGFFGGSITGNDFGIFLELHSTAEIGPTEISGNTEYNISVNTDSGVLLRRLVFVGEVECDGPESSVHPLVNVIGITDCTDF